MRLEEWGGPVLQLFMPQAHPIVTNPLTKVRDDIAEACRDAKRDPAAVTLLSLIHI